MEAIFRHKERRAVLHRDFFFDTLAADDSLKQWQFDIGERRVKLLALVGHPYFKMSTLLN